ncbi:40S ribosomal protein S25 [Cordyceps militaris CM01]|uniref:40S ribosomal protein S25 n=2 Tax=Cordyceps militaris TaxID=73501 RepID=G3J302_CORMM|nr:40S ribosomal protein S25 [Cordyceps militaris CM01]ATY65714.1 40S ribosomal S25 [Cordyceps militaris]EGX95585.1 40S ribosomal protein S25 [Cordyceps militaris CM01]
MGFFIKLEVWLGSGGFGKFRARLPCRSPVVRRPIAKVLVDFATLAKIRVPPHSVNVKSHHIKMAPAAGAKKQKKKWSKGKVKDKAQHAVLLDKTTAEKLYKDVQSYRLVTVAVLVDRMKINGSLARQCITDLEEKGLIKPVITHSKMKIYTRAIVA